MTHAPLPLNVRPANPHFERLGGVAVITALVDAFYRAMDTREDAAVVRAMHDPDLTRTKQVLVQYLTEWTGGPRAYSAERGTPMLRRRHYPFDIDTSARDAWMACMRQALAQTVADEALRAELDAAFWKIADFIRNTHGEPVDGATQRSHADRPAGLVHHPIAPSAPEATSSDPSPSRSIP